MLWQTGFQVFPRFNFCDDTHPSQDVQGFLIVILRLCKQLVYPLCGGVTSATALTRSVYDT